MRLVILLISAFFSTALYATPPATYKNVKVLADRHEKSLSHIQLQALTSAQEAAGGKAIASA